jgi:hypothetical protein
VNPIAATVEDMTSQAPYPPLREESDQLKALEMFQEGFKGRTDDLARELRRGDITIAEWERRMRDEVRDLHVGATVIAKGGDRRAVSFAEWGRVGGTIRPEYRYLHGFAQDLERSAMDAFTETGEFKSEAYLSWRSNLYAGAGKAAYYRGRAMGLLPRVPGDTNQQCGGNCNCTLSFEEGEYPWIVEVYWQLHPGESCEDCLYLTSAWDPYTLELPIGLNASEFVYWLNLGVDEFPLDRRDALALGG